MTLERVEQWFAARGWQPFAFQRACWQAYLNGQSGLLHAPTGTGKTLAVALGPMFEAAAEQQRESPRRIQPESPSKLELLWITPLRALAGDTTKALCEAASILDLHWRIELRTGDVSQAVKSRQKQQLPHCLVTTPESLSIMLSWPHCQSLLRGLRAVVVDEWHELLSTKRGSLMELSLARLRTFAPRARRWGVSATLGNLDEARAALVGPAEAQHAVVIRGESPKRIDIHSLRPPEIERFPWSGHIGIRLVEEVIRAIDSAATTLLFTNTRSQAEIWFAELLRKKPEWIGAVALHHGSLDHEIRTGVETLLRTNGREATPLKCVVCTSSLDLGVDFAPVDQVIQVGSPKGVARLIQRAGRSGHRPGQISRIVCSPGHALELVEFAAARDAVESGELEHRCPVEKPLDVLSQHLVTCASGGGFVEAQLKQEVQSTWAFRNLTDQEWQWVMDFVSRGGAALSAYPQYARIRQEADRWVCASSKISTLHRINIGTIVSDTGIKVQYPTGRTLGTIEESFIARLRTGDRFVFAGRVLELVRLHEMTAHVRKSTRNRGMVPRWNGGKMPLSSQLANAVRLRIAEARVGRFRGEEMDAVRPLFELQGALSIIPDADELLIETIRTREGHHAFLYPFAGRLAHEGLGAVLCYRLTRRDERTVRAVVTDYGIELLSNVPIDLPENVWRTILSTEMLVEDLVESLNATELARRQFREIARIAGLTFQGYPGNAKLVRHLQASSDMFYEVFDQFDPQNMLLGQARREVMEGQLEVRRILEALIEIGTRRLTQVSLTQLSPLAFPLWAESLRSMHATSEAWETQVRKMAVQLEQIKEEPMTHVRAN